MGVPSTLGSPHLHIPVRRVHEHVHELSILAAHLLGVHDLVAATNLKHLLQRGSSTRTGSECRQPQILPDTISVICCLTAYLTTMKEQQVQHTLDCPHPSLSTLQLPLASQQPVTASLHCWDQARYLPAKSYPATPYAIPASLPYHRQLPLSRPPPTWKKPALSLKSRSVTSCWPRL